MTVLKGCATPPPPPDPPLPPPPPPPGLPIASVPDPKLIISDPDPQIENRVTHDIFMLIRRHGM